MIQVIAIIKPFLAERVLVALCEQGHRNITIREVRGYGRQKSYLSEYQENEFSVMFLPKVEICVWAEDAAVDEVSRIIVQHSRSGRMGDGKVFRVPVVDCVEGF